MITIRKGTFETNSSSTHSLAIPKNKLAEYPKHIDFKFGRFGWEFKNRNPANYLYTAIYAYYGADAEPYIAQLKEALDSAGVSYTFQEPAFESFDYDDKTYVYISNGNVDHAENLGEFLDLVLSSNENILNFVTSGIALTGNDNEGTGAYINRFKPTYESYDWRANKIEELKNPYYKPKYENYTWVVKGNQEQK